MIIEEGYFTEADYAFQIKPKFPTLGSNIEVSSQGPLVSFSPNDSIRSLSGFNATTLYKKYRLPLNPVDILSFDNIFLECDIAQGIIFGGKRSGILHNFIFRVDPDYK